MNTELDKKAGDITGKVTDYLNSFNTKELNQAFCEAMANKAFCEAMSFEHRTLQQNFTGLCLAWIEFMGNTSEDFQRRFTDPRNKYSNKVCSEILEFMKEKGINSNLPCI